MSLNVCAEARTLHMYAFKETVGNFHESAGQVFETLAFRPHSGTFRRIVRFALRYACKLSSSCQQQHSSQTSTNMQRSKLQVLCSSQQTRCVRFRPCIDIHQVCVTRSGGEVSSIVYVRPGSC